MILQTKLEEMYKGFYKEISQKLNEDKNLLKYKTEAYNFMNLFNSDEIELIKYVLNQEDVPRLIKNQYLDTIKKVDKKINQEDFEKNESILNTQSNIELVLYKQDGKTGLILPVDSNIKIPENGDCMTQREYLQRIGELEREIFEISKGKTKDNVQVINERIEPLEALRKNLINARSSPQKKTQMDFQKLLLKCVNDTLVSYSFSDIKIIDYNKLARIEATPYAAENVEEFKNKILEKRPSYFEKGNIILELSDLGDFPFPKDSLEGRIEIPTIQETRKGELKSKSEKKIGINELRKIISTEDFAKSEYKKYGIIQNMADKYNASFYTMRNLLKKMNVKLQPSGYRSNEEIKQEIIEEYNLDPNIVEYSIIAAAKILGITDGNMHTSKRYSYLITPATENYGGKGKASGKSVKQEDLIGFLTDVKRGKIKRTI